MMTYRIRTMTFLMIEKQFADDVRRVASVQAVVGCTTGCE